MLCRRDSRLKSNPPFSPSVLIASHLLINTEQNIQMKSINLNLQSTCVVKLVNQNVKRKAYQRYQAVRHSKKLQTYLEKLVIILLPEELKSEVCRREEGIIPV